MHLSVLTVIFLIFGIDGGWTTAIVAQTYHPCSSQHPTLQAVVKWLTIAVLGMASLGFFLIGLDMLWYPPDAHGSIHPPANGLGSAAQIVAIVLLGSGCPLLIACAIIDRSVLHPRNIRR